VLVTFQLGDGNEFDVRSPDDAAERMASELDAIGSEAAVTLAQEIRGAGQPVRRAESAR
jgi:hypothetical protein